MLLHQLLAIQQKENTIFGRNYYIYNMNKEITEKDLNEITLYAEAYKQNVINVQEFRDNISNILLGQHKYH